MKSDGAALVLVDIQNDYFPGGAMELAGMPEAASKAAFLLDFFRGRGLPVYHVRHVSARPGATFFLPGTPGAEIHKSVAPLDGEIIIEKHYPNSFRGTGLLDALKGVCVNRLVVCGAMSHMCVDATVRAAFDFGFECVVAHDACATRGLSWNGVTVEAGHVHASFMAALGAVCAKVLSSEKTIDELSLS